MSSFTTRLTAVGLLAFTLVAGAAKAAPPPTNQERALPQAESADFMAAVRKWILSLVVFHPFPSRLGQPSVQPKEGSSLDPNGSH
jgi:hypothetical protein